jgi:hypothetical protein
MICSSDPLGMMRRARRRRWIGAWSLDSLDGRTAAT